MVEEDELLVTNMKRYRITKIIDAKDLAEANKKEPQAEVVVVELVDEIPRDGHNIGFCKDDKRG